MEARPGVRCVGPGLHPNEGSGVAARGDTGTVCAAGKRGLARPWGAVVRDRAGGLAGPALLGRVSARPRSGRQTGKLGKCFWVELCPPKCTFKS